MNNNIKEPEKDIIDLLEKDVINSIELIKEYPKDFSLDEEIEITKMKILYLIYHELKGINERLDAIIKQWKK